MRRFFRKEELTHPVDGPPHVCCDLRHFLRRRKVACKWLYSAKRKCKAHGHLNQECDRCRNECWACYDCASRSACLQYEMEVERKRLTNDIPPSVWDSAVSRAAHFLTSEVFAPTMTNKSVAGCLQGRYRNY